jgi:hypothetical protein
MSIKDLLWLTQDMTADQLRMSLVRAIERADDAEVAALERVDHRCPWEYSLGSLRCDLPRGHDGRHVALRRCEPREEVVAAWDGGRRP